MARLGVLLNGEGATVQQAAEYAAALEAAGFDSVWHTEIQVEPFVPLAAIAARTQRIRIGTGVATWTRSPIVAAQSAANLDALSGGRFVFGLGTGPRLFNESWHGLRYERPVESMREYVEAIRRVWRAHSGASASFDGTVERFRIRGFTRTVRQEREEIPVYLAAVQRRMLRLAGEVADGVLMNVFTTPRYVRDYARPQLAAGAGRAGRSLADLEVAGVVVAAVADDRAQARAWARQHLAWYAVLPYFDTMFALHGLSAAGAEIRDSFARGDWDAQLRAVSDEMLDTFAVAGTPDDCRARLGAWAEELDLVVLYPATVAMGDDEAAANRRMVAEAFADIAV